MKKLPFKSIIAMRKLTLLISLFALVAGFSTGCKGKNEIKEITKLNVDPSALTIKEGETKQLTVTWLPADLKVAVTYSSDKAEVATVSDRGLVTAVAKGEATITVKVANKEATVKVTVVGKNEVTTITELVVDPKEVSLKKGETSQLNVSWTPAEAVVTVGYATSKAEVATVSDKGLITAVEKGEATITVTANNKQAKVKVIVMDENVVVNGQNQLPILNFDAQYDNDGNLTSQDILDHEKALGRTQRDITIAPNQTFGGFANTDLLIPGVIYGLVNNAGSFCIYAYSKENTSSYGQTKKMLEEIGFTDLEEMVEEGVTYVLGKHKEQKNVSVLMTNRENKDLDAKMLVLFMREPDAVPVKVYQHEPVVAAQDFPSYEKLLTKDKAQIDEFENGLGVRDFNQEDSSADNFFYIVKEDKIAETNFHWVYYVCVPKSGPQFLNTALICVKDDKELFESPTILEWLANNGYTNPKFGTLEGGLKVMGVTNTTAGTDALLYVDPKYQSCNMQISATQSQSRKLSLEERVALSREAHREMLRQQGVETASPLKQLVKSVYQR